MDISDLRFDYLLNCGIAEKIAFGLIIIGVPVCIILLFIPAWYGRYASSVNLKIGSLSAKVSWILQECPSFLIPFFALCFHFRDIKNNVVNVICLGFYMLHYLYRSFIYPFRIKNGKRTPTELFLLAVLFCVLNGYIQAAYLVKPCLYRSISWLYDPRFIIGAIVFVIGAFINEQSDAILRNLRSDGSSDYKIPQGGMFDYVSGANYFGECIEWIGYAILTWNIAGVSFAFFTVANIGPRAVQHHRWYKNTFKDLYPPERKALIPFIFYFVLFKLIR